MNQFETQPAQSNATEGLFPGFPTLDIAKLVQLIFARLWIAIAIFGAFVALALIYVFTAEKIYESSALINIESSKSDGVFAGIKGVKKTSYESLDALKSIAAGLTSGSAMLRVVDKLDLRNDPTFIKPSKKGQYSDSEIVKFFSERLSSELIRGERNIYLSVRDTDPERARLIASTLISEFQDLLREQNSEAAAKTHQTLLAESVAQAERVDRAEIALQKFREEHPSIPLDEEDGVLEKKYLELQGIASRVSEEASRLKAEYNQYLKVKDQPERIFEIGGYSKLESIQRLILAKDQKVAEFYKIKKQYTPLHPTYQAYDNDVKGLEEQVRQAAIALGESIETRYLSAQQRAESAAEAVEEQAAANLAVEDIRRQFRTLKRSREAALATYDRLLERIEDTSVTLNVDETVIRTFSPPMVDYKPVKPKKTVTVALAGILGGMTGLSVILVMGLLDRTLTSKRQVESTLGISVLSEIPLANPDMKWDLRESIMVSKAPNSLVSEGFRALRTSLSSMSPRSVMFTSAMAEEGKSFCAANMAVLQAQFGYRTLLVDADFRNPKLAGIFTDPKLGETENGLVTQNHCQETVVPNLFLISLGRYMPDGGEPLNGEHFAAMLWEAYSNFDCVIIDSSPLCLVSDGLTYSRYADAVVLVVKSDHTQAGPAQEAVNELRRMRAPLAGCVLNGISKVDEAKERYVNRSVPILPQPVEMSSHP
ncbi:MAG: polysaccharide biosynthesis tyrosine autokinase [Verrucomicrobiales bacterium]|nr:polysaccharide biosynthesis tyrosine autokinase [Verrucomicrobiales bacterium]